MVAKPMVGDNPTQDGYLLAKIHMVAKLLFI